MMMASIFPHLFLSLVLLAGPLWQSGYPGGYSSEYGDGIVLDAGFAPSGEIVVLTQLSVMTLDPGSAIPQQREPVGPINRTPLFPSLRVSDSHILYAEDEAIHALGVDRPVWELPDQDSFLMDFWVFSDLLVVLVGKEGWTGSLEAFSLKDNKMVYRHDVATWPKKYSVSENGSISLRDGMVIRIFEAATGSVGGTYPANEGAEWALSADGKRIAVQDRFSGVVQVYDTLTNALVAAGAPDGILREISPTGSHIGTWGYGHPGWFDLYRADAGILERAWSVDSVVHSTLVTDEHVIIVDNIAGGLYPDVRIFTLAGQESTFPLPFVANASSGGPYVLERQGDLVLIEGTTEIYLISLVDGNEMPSVTITYPEGCTGPEIATLTTEEYRRLVPVASVSDPDGNEPMIEWKVGQGAQPFHEGFDAWQQPWEPVPVPTSGGPNRLIVRALDEDGAVVWDRCQLTIRDSEASDVPALPFVGALASVAMAFFAQSRKPPRPKGC